MSNITFPASPNPALIAPPVPSSTAQNVPAPGRPSITFEKHYNFAYSTIATAPSPATTGATCVVADASQFPSPTAPGANPYSVTIWPVSTQPTAANAEIATVVAVDYGTNTITFLAGGGGVRLTAEGTPARTIVAGDQIALTHTTKAMTDVEGAVLTLDGRLARLEGMRLPITLVWSGDIPVATGLAGAVIRVPRVNGNPVLLTLNSVYLRVETAGTATTTVAIQSCAPAETMFAASATTIASLSVASGIHEASASSSLGTVASGSLLRLNFTAISSTAAIYTVTIECSSIPIGSL